jgi:hypothetical protein
VRGIAIEHATHHHHSAGGLDLFAKDFGAVWRRKNRLGDVETDFPAIDVEGGDNLDILRLILAHLPMHQSDIRAIAGRVAIEVNALEE